MDRSRLMLVIKAAMRLLDKHDSYPDLVLSGSEESAKRFHEDVTMVTQAFLDRVLAELVADRGKS